MNHRVEVLRPGSTPEFQFWSNASGSIYLCREGEGDDWQAIVDGEVVVERTQDFARSLFTHPVKPLTATEVAGLVPLLAMQEGVHLILDRAGITEPMAAE